MTIGFQCLTTIRNGEQGILGGHAGGGGRMRGPGGGAGGHRESKCYMGRSRSNPPPLIPLTKFPGSAHGGGGNLFHWNALEQIA